MKLEHRSFDEWCERNIPENTRIINTMPNQNLGHYVIKKENNSLFLKSMIIILFTFIVVQNWERIVSWLEKLEEKIKKFELPEVNLKPEKEDSELAK